MVCGACGDKNEGSATARLGVRDFEIHWISCGFRISDWISGFQNGFLDFWISADGVRDFFCDGPLRIKWLGVEKGEREEAGGGEVVPRSF